MDYQKRKWTTAKKQIYNGNKYDSGFEASYAAELDLLLRAKKIKSWERQVKIPLDINGFHICNYYIDFRIFHLDGTIEFLETKGWATDVWKMKWRIFEALYSQMPNVKLTVIKQANNFKLKKYKKIK